MTDREKMVDLIINAKRTDPETGNFTEYLADFLLGYGVKLPTSTPHPGKPLTLKQLREMDGQPVWIVEYPDWGHWELSEDAHDYIVDRNLNFYGMKHDDPDGRYGLHKLGWLAYSYPPDQQQWIPVSERLPDPLEDVLVKCKTSMGGSYECIAQYIAPGTAEDETDVEWDWEVLDYNEKRDVYVVQPGWYESVKNWDEYGLCGILDIVTHWMPLPEPPEEG